ncbi:LytR/AlgR family response regulator transcription factor [Ottowia sp. VDI28]|uniref:LytR/AlgR family response regulator transcription factor n=1 Tax=Ottowia sp. VDI28 TaxID=3133968 RepID=UPI003C2E612B
MTSPPTALIAEDEPLLAAALAAELAKAWPELRIAATVGDGESAVEQALRLQPDVLFFDIRMPGQSGLDAAAELADTWDTGARPFPALAFVTAYDQYAVQAFETQAVDYVLKPVQPERLAKTVQKLREALHRRPSASSTAGPIGTGDALEATAHQLRQLLAALQPSPQAAAAPTRLRQLQVSSAAGSSVIRMVPLAEVLYLQAADKYVRVVTANGEHLLRTPLKELLPLLDAEEFWQIHRGTVVRASAIEAVQRDESGKYIISLRGHADHLLVSRLYSHLFKAM